MPTDPPGKYWTVGLDRSQNLLDFARIAGGNGTIHEVVRGDVLDNAWRPGAFVRFLYSYQFTPIADSPVTYSKDYAISIATIHHLATVERRVVAVKVRFM